MAQAAHVHAVPLPPGSLTAAVYLPLVISPVVAILAGRLVTTIDNPPVGGLENSPHDRVPQQ